MIDVPVGKPGDRQKRIEMVARICFGNDPSNPGQPISGWQTRLSRAMGLGRTAVHDTIKREDSRVFDRKLKIFVAARRIQIMEELKALEAIEKILDSGDINEKLKYNMPGDEHGQ